MRIDLAYPLTLEEIACATRGIIYKDTKNVFISTIATDSREISAGELFIALKGERYNGENYIENVTQKGGYHLSARHCASGILVNDSGDALRSLAYYYKRKFDRLRYTVGITGSVGKTTTKEFLKILLSEKYRVHATNKNLNNTLGVPLTVLSMPKDCEILVCEMGMNARYEISKSSVCISPDISIIINVGNSHIGNLGNRENIAKAKLEVLDGMKGGHLIIPYSEPLLNGVTGVTFDREKTEADFYLKGDKELDIFCEKKLFTRASFALSENHHKDCLIASVAAAYYSGLSSEDLRRGIFKISSKNTRQSVISTKNFFVLADFYNSSPESVKAALNSLFQKTEYKLKSALIGDILELGDYSEAMHRSLGKTIANYNLAKLYLFGKYSKNIYEGVRECGFPENRIFLNSDPNRHDITAKQISDNTSAGEIILMKASRGMRLEKVLKELSGNENFDF